MTSEIRTGNGGVVARRPSSASTSWRRYAGSAWNSVTCAPTAVLPRGNSSARSVSNRCRATSSSCSVTTSGRSRSVGHSRWLPQQMQDRLVVLRDTSPQLVGCACHLVDLGFVPVAEGLEEPAHPVGVQVDRPAPVLGPHGFEPSPGRELGHRGTHVGAWLGRLPTYAPSNDLCDAAPEVGVDTVVAEAVAPHRQPARG